MKTLNQQLSGYGDYHRDRRNVATHLVGIPLIVVAVEILLSRPLFDIAGAMLTPAMPLSALAAIFYLRLDLRFGLVMAAILAAFAWLGLAAARGTTATWLGLGIGLFVVGWAFQFVGHWFEGRKPAFLDDIAGLIVGPLFVVAEVAFILGLRRDVHGAIAPRDAPLRA